MNQPDKKTLAWLVLHNPGFAEAYKVRKRIEAEQAENRKQMAKAIKQAEKVA